MKNNDNFIVMSESGKPIISRFGSQEYIVRISGLIQAVRTAINGHKTNFGLGEIQSIQSKKLSVSLMTVGSITLVSVSKRAKSDNDNVVVAGTEAYSKLQLEYVYAHFIFILTTNVQNIFTNNPGFDLRSILNFGDNLLHGLLDDAGPDGNFGPFLISGVQSCFP